MGANNNVNPQNPKVSIILPTYNGEKYLRQSIDSCLKQTYRNIELIIVDDCSQDDTLSIIQSFSDPRIKFIRNKKNMKLPRSLNIGFKQASGEYLTWTSDDNRFLPTAIEEMLIFLNEHKRVDFVYADMIISNLETGHEEIKKLPELDMGKDNYIGACYLFTRKAYELVGKYDHRLEWVEDYDYWIRLSKKCQLRHYLKPLYIYGLHPNSITSHKYYQVAFIRELLRHHYNYITLDEMGNEFSRLISKVNLNSKTKIKFWLQLIKKAFQIPPAMGRAFFAVFIKLTFSKTVRSMLWLINKAFWKPFAAIKLFLLSFQLKKSVNKKNVLCMVPYMVVGGSEKVIQDVVVSLQPSGYDFHLLTIKKQDNAWCDNFSRHFRNVVLLDGILDEPTDSETYYQYLSLMIKRLEIKIMLITNSFFAYGYVEKLKNDFKHLKIVDILHLEHVGAAKKKLIGVSNFIDKRVCISEHLKNYMTGLCNNCGIRNELIKKLVVIYNGVDVNKFNRDHIEKEAFKSRHKIKSQTKIISFVGRMAPEKRPFLFIDIARELIFEKPDESWKFVMAGGGPYFNAVKAHIKYAGLEKYFILLGMIPDIKGLLSDTYLLLLLSNHEGIPLVIQEAMAMGVPAISTRVGAIHEIIKDDTNGYLVDPNADIIEQCVKKVLRLVNDTAHYNDMAKNAERTISPEFTLENMSLGYRKILEELLDMKDVQAVGTDSHNHV
ncbi:MAG: glycosyltransferase [Nanoarchaeota archaeon]